MCSVCVCELSCIRLQVRVSLLISQSSLSCYSHTVIKNVAACFLRFLGSAPLPILVWALSCLYLCCTYPAQFWFFSKYFLLSVGSCPGREPWWPAHLESSLGLECSFISNLPGDCLLLRLQHSLLDQVKPLPVSATFSNWPTSTYQLSLCPPYFQAHQKLTASSACFCTHANSGSWCLVLTHLYFGFRGG